MSPAFHQRSVLRRRKLRGRDRLNLVVEDDTLDDIADIAAVEHMRDIGHWNNDEAAGVGR